MPVRPAVLGKRRAVTRLQVHAGRGIVGIRRRFHVGLVQVDGVVHHGDDGEDVTVPRDELGHRVHVSGLRASALQVSILEVSARDLQRVPDPLPGREARPAVRGPRWRMRPPVHENRPVQRPHELDVIRPHFPREGVLFLEDARSSEAAPLVGGRVRSALILRCSPDRLGGGVRPHPARVVERNPEIVTQRRLRRGVLLVVVKAPFPGDVGGSLRPSRLGKRWDTDQHRRGDEKHAPGNPIGVVHISPILFQQRDYASVRDVVKACLRVCEQFLQGRSPCS